MNQNIAVQEYESLLNREIRTLGLKRVIFGIGSSSVKNELESAQRMMIEVRNRAYEEGLDGEFSTARILGLECKILKMRVDYGVKIWEDAA